MRVTALRPANPSRSRRARDRHTVEALEGRIASAVGKRQELRTRGSSAALLERNRLEIVRWQWELSHALIARHLPPTASPQAA
jgi:hypothetical protein